MVSGVVGVLETSIMVFHLKQVVNVMICRIGLTGGVDCRAWCWNKDWAYPAYSNVSNTFTILLLGHMACGTFLWVITMGWSLNDVGVAVSRFSFCCCDRRLINRVQWISFLSWDKGFMRFTWDHGKTSWCQCRGHCRFMDVQWKPS